MPRWSKITLKVFGGIIALLLLVYVAAAYYISANKKQLLERLTVTLNRNLDGRLDIGSMDPAFLTGFPGVSVRLKNVRLKDRQFARHRHTLLSAGDLQVSLNMLALFTGTIEMNKIRISNANVYLFTDSTGYSNTSVFKKKGLKPKSQKSGGSDLEFGRFELENVGFILDNRKGHKLFQFSVDKLKGSMDYSWSDWQADLKMRTFVKSLAFNTKRGSFVKEKWLEGPFQVNYSDAQKIDYCSTQRPKDRKGFVPDRCGI